MAKKAAAVKPKRQPGRVSMSMAAIHVDLSVPAFSRLLDLGVIQRQPREVGYDLDECRVARFRHLEALAAGRSGVDGGELLSKQRARLATAQAHAQEMRTGILAGEYVRLSVFEKVTELVFMTMREIALGMPGKIANTIAEISGVERGAIHSLIDAEIREMLTSLSTPDVIARGMDRKAGRLPEVDAITT